MMPKEPPPKDDSNLEASKMPLIEHLVELRQRVFVSLIAVVVCAVIAFVFAEDIYDVLTAPFLDALASSGTAGGLSLVHSPFEGIYTYIRVGILGGVVLSTPVLAYQAWQFVAPGLYHMERRVVLPLAVTSTFLFSAGAAFAYFVIFPVAFPMFVGVLDATANISISGYLNAVIRLLVVFGLSFQLPVITWFFAVLGLINHRDLLRWFRYAIVVIFLASAIITPPDIITQVLLSIPLIFLYGVSIVVAKLTSRKRVQ